MTLRRSRFRVLRLGLLLVALAVMACGNNAGTQAPGSQVPGGPAAGAGALAQEPFTPSPVAQYLLDTATFQTRANGKYSATIVATLPTGVAVETTYTIDPTPISLASLPPSTVPGSPLQAFALAPHKTQADGNFAWRYEYVIPTDGFPKDAFTAAASDGAPAWLWHAVQALVEPATAYASGGDGLRATVQGGGIGAGTEFLVHLESHGLHNSGALTKGAAAIYSLYESWHIGKDYLRGQRQIEALRRCAANPTNPLTQAAYAKDPRAKQAVLDEVAATQQDSTLNTTVQFIGVLNARAASLVGKAAPWLPVLVEAGTAGANANLSAVTSERIGQLERLVPRCDIPSGTWTGEITWTYKEVRDRFTEDGSATATFSATGGEWSGQRTRTEDHNAKDCAWIRTFATKGEGTIGLSVLDLSGRNPLAAPGNPPGQAQPQTATLVIMPASQTGRLVVSLVFDTS